MAQNVTDIIDRDTLFKALGLWRNEIGAFIFNTYGPKVQQGVFADMIFPRSDPTKLLGSYEQELFPYIEKIIAQKPKRIINIGAYEGWYAVGMAYRLPETEIIAFEMEEWKHADIKELAEQNDIKNNFTLLGECNTENLKEYVREGDVLIIDCEGAEVELLDPEKIPALKKCTILVEMHDFIVRNATGEILDRFNDKDIEWITHEPFSRNPDKFKKLQMMSEIVRFFAVCEHRPALMHWLYIKAD